MTRDEYNRKLQEVQQIECQLGRSILEGFQFYDEQGQIAVCGFTHRGATVFQETKPFTPDTEYEVNEQALRRIIYCDFTR
jgi:hypothetical protein